MADNNTGLIGIRQELNARGVDNSRIGYDKNTGYVTIDGQNFMKPANVANGVSMVNQGDFNNQYNVYDTSTKAKTAQDQFTNPDPYTNPYDQQITDTFGQIMNMINNPQAIDPYSTEQYKAAQAQVQRGAQQATRQAQESMGASGFGRSTNLADRAQGIQNDANVYLQSQVLPGIVQQLQSEQNQKLANLFGLVNALSGQQTVSDNRYNSEQDRLAKTVDFLTGRSDRAEDTLYRAERDKVTDAQQNELLAIQQAAVTGMYKGKPTTAEQQRVLENAWTESQQTGKVSESLAKLTGIPVGTLLESTRQFNAQIAESQADRAQRASDAAADRAASNANAAANRALEREKMAYQKELDKVAADTQRSDNMKQEASAMLGALRDGSVTPTQALSQIDDDLKAGLYSPSEASYLKSLVQNGARSAANPDKATPEQVAAANASGTKSDSELEKEAIQLGYPTIDYRAWYKASNGRAAGLSYEQWKSLYGPELKAR